MRQRNFDVDEALDCAMEVFWSKGYATTSIDDLCQAMDIGRSSLYQAFGSKPRLLEIVIDRYTVRAAAILSETFAEPQSFNANVRKFLERLANGAVTGELRRGCFIGEMIAEFPANATKETRLLEQKVRILKAVIASEAQLAIERGELNADIDPENFAHFLFATIQGLRLTGKVDPDETVLKAIIDTALLRVA